MLTESATNRIAEASAAKAPNADLEQRLIANQIHVPITLAGMIANSQSRSYPNILLIMSSIDQKLSDNKAKLTIMMHQPMKNPLKKEFLCVVELSLGTVSIFGYGLSSKLFMCVFLFKAHDDGIACG
jgi:hypothetical protein